MPSRSNGMAMTGSRATSRSIFGGLPNSTLIGKSTGRLANCRSLSTSCRSAVATPITAYGQRSRSHSALKVASLSAAMANT